MEQLKATLQQHDQGHLLAFYEELDDEGREGLVKDLQGIDFEEMTSIFAKSAQKTNLDCAKMVPIEEELCESFKDSPNIAHYDDLALKAIGSGHVGVLLLAGGQGTRLGVDYPKGMFDIGLPSKKSLYHIQTERILRLERMAFDKHGLKGHITLYIMTSEHTKAKTENFFKGHDYFGMKAENVVIFEQRMIPTFDFKGRILLQPSKAKVARAPDGNGGLYWALKHEKALEDMERRDIRFLHAYCVDNVLVKVADPTFLGFGIAKGVESANKVVEKIAPEEAVGVVCRVQGAIQVVEYSEIGEDVAKKRTPDNAKLLFNGGNICNHYFTTAFLRKICERHLSDLPHHVAKKKIPSATEAKPETPNGIKLEKFVFDAFEFSSSSFAVWECSRHDEFSPLKNAEGASKDTPTTAKRALLDLHRRYLRQAGAIVDDESAVEISPLISYAGENLEKFRGETFQGRNLRID